MAKASKAKRVATLTIHGPGRMTKKGRSKIASWLRRHADMLVKDGANFTEGRFTGGYNVA